MNNFGDRLREERVRLGMNQTDFAQAGGVTKGSQFNYEAGHRAPDLAYLAAVSALGVDVQYVVTGIRQTPPQSQPVHEARQSQKPYGAQPQVQIQGQGQSQDDADDWPETPTGPAISLEIMRRVVGLVDAVIEQRGRPDRDKEVEMIVMAYNYVVVGDEDETKETAVQDREVTRVVRLVANG
jgi:transcriptional regulator with XRE-family HTH domain